MDATKDRLRNWARIAARPKSWPLEILFVFVCGRLYSLFFDPWTGVMEFSLASWEALENFVVNPLIFLAIVVAAFWSFYSGVTDVQKEDARRAQEIKDFIGIQSESGASLTAERIGETTRIMDGLLAEHADLKRLALARQTLDRCQGRHDQCEALLSGVGGHPVRTHWISPTSIEMLVRDLRALRGEAKGWRASAVQMVPVKNVSTGTIVLRENPDWVGAMKADLAVATSELRKSHDFVLDWERRVMDRYGKD